jgi:hypothetical protein
MTEIREIRSNLYQKLATDPGVKAIAADRIYPGKLKEGAQIPAISYQLVDGLALAQAHNQASELDADMYQINCWGPTLADAVKLGGAVCLYKGKRDVIDPAGRLFCRQLDFRITFK